ncbi:MAG: PepSY-like domain-containing protein [Flavisolibacter sp.]
MRKVISLLFVFAFFLNTLDAQVRKIPSEVTTAFEKQYPSAREVEYKDILTGVHVEFVLDSLKMIAKYTNKGEWKETEKEWSFDKLLPDVQEGFQKSKYANEWKVKDASIISLPGNAEHYRLKIEKSDLQKKYLYFSNKGQLIREAMTI